MIRLTILSVFLFILFIQFNQQQAADIHHTSFDDIEDPLFPSPAASSLLNLWYNQLYENEPRENFQHIWKRFSPDLTQLRQRRRFGNTRYGRSLPNDSK